MNNKLNEVMDILLSELKKMSETNLTGAELNEQIDKARTVALVACQYVSADAQKMRREMYQNQNSYRSISYVSE